MLLVLYGWGLPPFRSPIETTDNAYVRGQTTIIAPQVNGHVTNVPVHDYEQVTGGQVRARIDDRIYRQRVEQARANLTGREAELANAQLARARADMRRVNELVEQGSASLRERDQTQAALRQAEAAVGQAQAQQAAAQEGVQRGSRPRRPGGGGGKRAGISPYAGSMRGPD